MTTKDHAAPQNATLAVEEFEGWRLYGDATRKMFRDLDLAERAGLALPRDIRRTIQKCAADGLITIVGSAHDGPPPHSSAVAVDEATTIGSGASRDVTTFYLDEHAAVHVLMRLRTPEAIEAQRAVVDVFVRYRHRGAAPVAQAVDVATIRAMLDQAIASVSAIYAGQLADLKAQLTDASAPSIGPSAAQFHILGPLREVARLKARALGAEADTKRVSRLRFAAERSLRERLGFPMIPNARWAMFPRARLGEACVGVAFMLGEARALLAAAKPKPTQLTLLKPAAT